MSRVLGIDIGYSDIKVVETNEKGEILQMFKIPSLIGVTKKNELINDSRIIEYKGYNYYVGNDALSLPSDNHVSIIEYKNLEYYAPVFLYFVLQKLNDTPDVIVTGLSKAQINNSGHFKDALQSFVVNSKEYKFDNIFVLPQGAGSKLTIDKYGSNFPQEQTSFLGNSTYIGSDIGGQTIDMFQVSDGKTSPNLFEGIENEGVMKIAKLVAIKVKEVHGRQISLQEAKEILNTGIYKLRGSEHDLKDYVKEVKDLYIKELLELIEEKYGKILDKCDFVFLSGGGSAFFKDSEDGFIKVPKNKPEFYNTIGFALWGVNKVNS